MSAAVNIDSQPIDELWDSKPHLAARLRESGYDSIVTLDSDKAVAMAYGTPDGRLEFVHGSRALFDRYIRMTRPKARA